MVHTAGIELVESIEDVKWLGSCWLFFLDNNLFFDSSLCSQLVLFRAFCGLEPQHADKKINVHAIFWSFSPFITANAQARGEPIFLCLSFYCVLTLNHWVHYNLYLTRSCFISSFKIAWALYQQCARLTHIIPSPSHYLGLY